MSNTGPDFSVRVAGAGVDKSFVQRWSPRAYLSKPVSQTDLGTLFDAARWTPSCFNEQPWLFLTSTDSSYETFLSLLVEGNQSWAKSAPVLGFVVASKVFARNGKDNFHNMFDAGAAWMAMSLQASQLGLYTHGMGGILHEEIYKAFDIDPSTHQVICGFTLGYVDTEKDEEITTRKPLTDIWRQA